MTVEESRKLIATLMVTYPNYRPIDVELAARTWANVTGEYPYREMDKALQAYMRINTSGFAPVPAQLIETLHDMTEPEGLNEMEAWSLVRKAIGRGSRYFVEEYEKLPPAVQKAVGQASQLRTWATNPDFNEDVASSNFMRAYRIETKRERELAKMPPDVRKLIDSVNQNTHKAQIEQKRMQAIKSLSEQKKAENKAITSREATSRGISARTQRKIDDLKRRLEG